MKGQIVTAVDLARKLRVGPKAFRQWLRDQARAGNGIAASHLKNERWEFTESEADVLAFEFRAAHGGRPVAGSSSPTTDVGVPLTGNPSPEVEVAIEALSAHPSARLDLADVAFEPGLYALWAATRSTLEDLRLADIPGQRALLDGPLYVGKAEDSLLSRVVGTHFATGRTGHSTVRRTFAALLDLRSCPRPTRIGDPTPKQIQTMTANYGLLDPDEKTLTDWMRFNLTLTTCTPRLESFSELERQVSGVLRPPLDQERTPLWDGNPWRPQVAEARERLRIRARELAEQRWPKR